MAKRSRHSSQESGSSDLTNREISALHSTIHSSLTMHSLDSVGVNGNKEVIIKSRPHGHFHRRGPTMKDLWDQLFPVCRFLDKGYGKVLTGTVIGTTTTQFSPTVAVAKAIVSEIGLQGFYQFSHLTLNDKYGAQSTVNTVASILNDTLASKNITETSAPTGDVGDPLINLQAKYKSCFYQGGYTEHVFYNPGNVEITVEFWEVRPKRFLLAQEDPMSSLCTDKQLKGVKFTGKSAAEGTAYMQPTNVDFTVAASDHIFHDKFFCSNNRRIKVLGGETVKVFVKHPPFTLNGCTQINSMINAQYLEQLTSTSTDLDYLPFSTVWLLVRMIGQVETNDTGGAVINSINYGKAQLGHIQREHHACRAGFYTNKEQTYENNGLTDTLPTAFLDNPLTDTPVAAAW